MSDAPTLHSRLRILVAKTFRAEKLYASVRNQSSNKHSGASAMSELANDIRARVWQQAHYRLRTALNEILADGNSSLLIADIAALRDSFDSRAEESFHALEEGARILAETGKRQEFTRCLKLSVELVQHKAQAQANKVISDELSAVLDAAGRKARSSAPSARNFDNLLEEFTSPPSENIETEAESDSPSNVISLQERRVGGSRLRRR